MTVQKCGVSKNNFFVQQWQIKIDQKLLFDWDFYIITKKLF